MSRRARLGVVVQAQRTNAALAWLLVVFVGVVVALSVVDGDLIWAGFALAVAALALVPTATHRRATVMLPWEVLLLAVLPLIGRTFATVPLTSVFFTYLAVAALALVIAVELHMFTPVRMTAGFAVVFVVIATMATAGLWAVLRWLVDLAFGTQFLLDPTLTDLEIERRLMWEFVYSIAAGLVGGLIFEGYFRRWAHVERRLPDELEAAHR